MSFIHWINKTVLASLKQLVPLVNELLDARKKVRNLLDSGLIIHSPLPGKKGETGYQTMVHLDGDLCLCIHKKAFSSPDFEEGLKQHLVLVKDMTSGFLLIQGYIRRLLYLPHITLLGISLYKLDMVLHDASKSGLVYGFIRFIYDPVFLFPLMLWGLFLIVRFLISRKLRFSLFQKDMRYDAERFQAE